MIIESQESQDRLIICRHCGRVWDIGKKIRLCTSCISDVSIRSMYLKKRYTGCDSNGLNKTSKETGYGLEKKHGRRPIDSNPTSALPGTEEKVLVLMYRAKNGLYLWHPKDAIRDE